MRPKGPLVAVSGSPGTYTENASARGDLILTSDPKANQVEVKDFDALAFPSPLLDTNITGAKKLVSKSR